MESRRDSRSIIQGLSLRKEDYEQSPCFQTFLDIATNGAIMNVTVESKNMMKREKVEDSIHKQTMLHYNQIVENMKMDTITSYKRSCLC